MFEAVTVLSWMMMTLIVSYESRERETHTDRHTHRQTLASSIVNVFKVLFARTGHRSTKAATTTTIQNSPRSGENRNMDQID